jgi:hypothetical protein
MFGRLKDWRRIVMRYDRSAQTFFSAIALAATVILWLGQCVLSLVGGSAPGALATGGDRHYQSCRLLL